MAPNRNAQTTAPLTRRSLANCTAQVIAIAVIISQPFLLISDATPLSLEIGENDFRISDMGTNGYDWATASNPAIAYNSTNNEYLVVWQGDDVYDDRFEILGQRIDAATGAELGGDFRISDMGANDTDASFGAYNPAVAYSSTQNEYLVVWSGDDTTDGEYEIYGQRLDAATGAETGTPDFRISDMGDTDGDTTFNATVPAIAYNTTDNEYLVVWQGDDTVPGDNDLEIFGQRIDATDGSELGSDFRITDMGTNDGNTYSASDPAVAYNPVNNEYLVVWDGDDDTGALADAEFEIYGQRLDATDCSEVGTNDFRISSVGTDGNRWVGAFDPAVIYNPLEHDYLVVWEGDTLDLTNDELEIYGQRLDATTGAEIGADDFRISDMGITDGDHDYDGKNASLTLNTADNEYLVVWQGDDDTPSLNNNEFEIYGQRLDGATCAELGDNDFRISDMGDTDGDPAFEAHDPAVAYADRVGQYLVVWKGSEHLTSPSVREFEIFGQRLMLPTLSYHVWD